MDTPEIFRALGRIEAELHAVAKLVSELKNDSKVRLDDHEARLRKLESFAWKATGVLAVLTFALNIILKKWL